MIISKTPYRISFFGGGSDYPEWYLRNGGEVISSTINKYLYISCRELSDFFSHKYRIIYSKMEEVRKIQQIKHRVVRLILLKNKIKKNLEIHYNGDLPARSGMGSSSSFIVGLLNAINSFQNHNISKTKLAYDSIFLEQKILKECVGSQDQVACSFGGFNSIKFRKNNTFLVNELDKNSIFKKNLNKNLVLLYSGRQRTAEKVAKRFIKKINSAKKQEINDILGLVKVAKELINNNDYYSFGQLLDESWRIKKKLDKDITNSFLDDIYNQAKFNGAVGGKILGAGAGGFFLFYVPENNRKYFIKKMSFLTHVPFAFESEGSQIIYKN
jgi:D-glycero-alpha-D-manno-heptose-7-phosphate kinase